MKYFAIVAVFTFGILGFTVSKSNVKVTTNPTKIDNILKEERVILNKITCKLKDGNLCHLEVDSTEISVDCGCEEGELILEPNIKALVEWELEEKMKVTEFTHKYFSKSNLNISEIKFFKTENKHFILVKVSEKMKENRFLFSYTK